MKIKDSSFELPSCLLEVDGEYKYIYYYGPSFYDRYQYSAGDHHVGNDNNRHLEEEEGALCT